MNEEPAGAGDPGDKLGEVGGPPCRQGAQCCHLGDGSILATSVAAADELIDEAPVVVDGGEVAAAAQDQRLIEGRLEMAVVGLDRTVLVRLAGVVAAGDEPVVAAERRVAPGDIRGLVATEVAVGR